MLYRESEKEPLSVGSISTQIMIRVSSTGISSGIVRQKGLSFPDHGPNPNLQKTTLKTRLILT